MSGADIAPGSLIQLLRSLLAEQGETGRWLLERIDEVLEAGVEDDFQDGQLALHDSLSAQVESGLIFRAPNDRWEILDIHLAVLEAYLVALPSCIAGTMQHLESLHASGAAIVLRSDRVTDDLIGSAPGQISLAELVPPSWREKQHALQQIRTLVHAARS